MLNLRNANAGNVPPFTKRVGSKIISIHELHKKTERLYPGNLCVATQMFL